MTNQAFEKYSYFVKEKFNEDSSHIVSIYEDLYERDAPHLELEKPETDEEFIGRCIELDFDDGYDALAFPMAFVDDEDFNDHFSRDVSNTMAL